MKKEVKIGVIMLVIAFAFGAWYCFFVKPNNNMPTLEQTETARNSTYHNDVYGIEFQYPADLEIEGPPVSNFLAGHKAGIYYYARNNVNPKHFSITIATTTFTDVLSLKDIYKKRWPQNNPTIISSEVIVINDMQVLKQTINDGNKINPSIWTLHSFINKGKSYAVMTGIIPLENPYKATPDDRIILEHYLDLFLSTVKFF